MSKFRTRLRQTAQGARSRQIGFTPAASTTPAAQLLVAAITDDPSAVPALIEAGAGAIVTTSIDALEGLVAAAGDRPVGIRQDATTSADIERITAARADFVAFDHTHTHAEALLDPDLGRVLLIERDVSEEELRLIAAMQLDAVIVGPPPQPLVVSDQLALRRIVDIAGAPLVVPAAEPPAMPTLHAWRNAGTLCVLVPGDPALVSKTLETARQIPAPRPPREDRGGMALVPALSGHAGEFEEEDY